MHVRHEEAGAFAAAAEAELTGRLAVCAGSCGPGNLHLINGLYDANRTRVPVLAIASHIPSAQIGTQFFQETHPDRLFLECSVYSEMISTAAQAPRVIRSAIHHAYGGPGVAVLTLPGDVADLDAPDAGIDVLTPPPAPRVVPDEGAVRALADAIDAAGKVTIFAGAGVRGVARPRCSRWPRVLHAPVGHSLRGKEVIQVDNPFDVGMSGLLGYGACQSAMEGADLLLLLGTDFPYDQFLPSGVRTAQVDIEPTRLGRRTRNDLVVLGDVGETVTALLAAGEAEEEPPVPRPDAQEARAGHERAWSARTPRTSSTPSRSTPSSPPSCWTRRHPTTPCSPSTPACATSGPPGTSRPTAGAGSSGRSCTGRWPTRSRTPSARPCPAAVGTSSRWPATAACRCSWASSSRVKALDLPVKIVVFDNATLGMVRLEMLVDGLPSYATDTPPVDYAAIASAIGIPSVRVEKPTEIRTALRAGVLARRPRADRPGHRPARAVPAAEDHARAGLRVHGGDEQGGARRRARARSWRWPARTSATSRGPRSQGTGWRAS